jgi:alkylhydroperoxidase/carboxymuconolactone decarboxylase family protein YurZ
MWGKPDALDRLAQALVALAAVIALGNGLFMLVSPLGWYEWLGTVKATGPANGHFIRDIGLAYLMSGGLLAYGAANLPMRWGSALAGASWMALHGGLHVWEVAKGLCSAGIFWTEAPGTLGPPLIALTGIGLQMARQRVSSGPMPVRLFMPLADKMTWHLAPNLADFAEAPGHLAEKFAQFMPFTLHRHAASAEQVAMARLGGVMAEDCGPCVEIAARGALREGVARETVKSGLDGTLSAGPARQAFDFAQAIALQLPTVDELGEAIEAEYGRAVRTELTVAAATVRVHPAFKRGLGYAKSCAAHRFTL